MSSDGLTIKERIALLKSKEKEVQDQKSTPKPISKTRPNSIAISSPFLNKNNSNVPAQSPSSSAIVKEDKVEVKTPVNDSIPAISIKDRISNFNATNNNTSINNISSPNNTASRRNSLISKDGNSPNIATRRHSITKAVDKESGVLNLAGLNPQFCRPVTTTSSSIINDGSNSNKEISNDSIATSEKTQEEKSDIKIVNSIFSNSDSSNVKSNEVIAAYNDVNKTVDKSSSKEGNVETTNTAITNVEEIKSDATISDLDKNTTFSPAKVDIPISVQPPIKPSPVSSVPSSSSTSSEPSITMTPSKRPVSTRINEYSKNINAAALNSLGSRPVIPLSERKIHIEQSILTTKSENDQSDSRVITSDSTSIDENESTLPDTAAVNEDSNKNVEESKVSTIKTSNDNSNQTPIKQIINKPFTSPSSEPSTHSTPSKRPVSTRINEFGKNINVAALNPFGPRPVFPSERKPHIDQSILPTISENEQADNRVISSDSTSIDENKYTSPASTVVNEDSNNNINNTEELKVSNSSNDSNFYQASIEPVKNKPFTSPSSDSSAHSTPSKRPVSTRINEFGKNINVAALNPFGPRPVFPSDRKTHIEPSILPTISENEQQIIKPSTSDSLSTDFSHVSMNRPKTMKRPPSKRIADLNLEDIDLLLANPQPDV